MTLNKLHINKGFSLVEMAVVLVVLGLVMASILTPLTAQRDLKDMVVTQTGLDQIREAIYGFVVLNGRLPCPTSEPDPASSNYGIEDCSITTEAYLPWKTLGLTEGDGWLNRRMAPADPWIGYWRYKADTNFMSTTNFSNYILQTASNTVFADNLAVQDSSGNLVTSNLSGAEKPIAVIYSLGKNLTADGANNTVDNLYQSSEPTTSYDDMLIWITRPVLINRLVNAGKLS